MNSSITLMPVVSSKGTARKLKITSCAPFRFPTALLKVFESQLLTQAALDRAMPVDEVRAEVGKFVSWLGGLGSLDFDTEYRPHEFRFEIKWVQKKD